jgi:hypothetical protein
VLRLVALVGHGGHQGHDRVVCAFWARGLVFVLRFLRDEAGFPRLFGGPLWLSPTVAPEHLRASVGIPQMLVLADGTFPLVAVLFRGDVLADPRV